MSSWFGTETCDQRASYQLQRKASARPVASQINAVCGRPTAAAAAAAATALCSESIGGRGAIIMSPGRSASAAAHPSDHSRILPPLFISFVRQHVSSSTEPLALCDTSGLPLRWHYSDAKRSYYGRTRSSYLHSTAKPFYDAVLTDVHSSVNDQVDFRLQNHTVHWLSNVTLKATQTQWPVSLQTRKLQHCWLHTQLALVIPCYRPKCFKPPARLIKFFDSWQFHLYHSSQWFNTRIVNLSTSK